MKYRREVDGLRALAVVPVMLFHAGIGPLTGGYLGVDIFFVISGYLITGILLKEIAAGEFSLWRFYERRARRILPALSVMVLACIPMAWFFMLPDPLENFGQSVVATMLSLNNVLLTMTSGYWDLASEFKPLIHTWSLGVEEQFYLIFPVLLMVAYPLLRGKTVGLVWLIVIVSYVSCILLYTRHPDATFYLLHTRAWELGAGALAAFWEHRRKFQANNLLSGLGLLLILASMLLFTASTPHPSYGTAAPVIGTLLVLLYARTGSVVASLLGLRPLVGIGLISYSLYLWHQPLFTFARVLSFDEPGKMLFVLLLAACFVIAYLSWRFVEQPFRRGSVVSVPALVSFSLVSTVSLALVGGLFHMANGFPSRVFGPDSDVAAGMHISYNHRISRYSAAAFDPDAGTRVLVIGNSQARDFANILIETGLMDAAQIIYRVTLAVCEPDTLSGEDRALVAQADVIYVPVVALPPACNDLIASAAPGSDKIVFVGPKHFGYNLNAFVRLPVEGRPTYTTQIFPEIIADNIGNAQAVPPEHYIDLIGCASEDGEAIRVFDDAGNIISADRVHITRAGAQFFAACLMNHPALAILRPPVPHGA